ncbi:MAG: hypothetical protein NVS4B10_25940 [Myxococcales bacterium]
MPGAGLNVFDRVESIIVEGIIDHQILGTHHVHPGDGQLAWDIGFLVFGVLQIGLGWSAILAGRDDRSVRGVQAGA